MVEVPAKIVVNDTPGKNEKVDNTINIEHLLDHLQKGARQPSGPVPDEQKEPQAKAQQLAADLLRELSKLRGGA
jgi:hypothetical protein